MHKLTECKKYKKLQRKRSKKKETDIQQSGMINSEIIQKEAASEYCTSSHLLHYFCIWYLCEALAFVRDTKVKLRCVAQIIFTSYLIFFLFFFVFLFVEKLQNETTMLQYKKS